MLPAMIPTATGPVNLAGILPSDAWPQSAVILTSVAVFLFVVGLVAAALDETRGRQSWKRTLAILATFWAVGAALAITGASLQGEAQRSSISASETAFRSALDDRYGARTGSSLRDVMDAAKEGRTVVLVSGGQSVQASPHVDGELLTFFTADGKEYHP